MAKAVQTIKRDDGSEVRITAEEFFGLGLHRSVGVYVHRRASPDAPWTLCNDRPHPDWRKMSVDEYVKRGRSEMLRTVSHGEILRVAHQLEQVPA
jgi:hypothetical protein